MPTVAAMIRLVLGVVSLAMAIVLPHGSPAAQPADPRPNIILILLDDWRHDAMGALNPALRTPNLDRVVREGVRYANAFVTTSLCSPSRATILTGRSMRNHRVFTNERPEPSGTVYFPSYLQQAGYRTAMIGKWHMGEGNQGGSDAPRPGFDHWVSFPGQGYYLPEQAPGGVVLLNVNGERVPQKGYITDELTDYTIDWLRAGRDDARPFFLHLAHKAIHVGFTPAARHKDRYQDLLLAPPPTYADTAQNYAGKPRWVRAQRNSWHGVDYAYYVHEGMAGLAKLRRRYLETLLAVDDSVGRILAELEAQGLERRTIVLLMGDNGFLFGEHGLVDKRHAYEDSIRIPLLAYAPGRFPAGAVVEGLVSNLDIAPTVLDLAGVARPEPFEGRSFAGLTTGAIPEAAWRGELVYEYYWEPGFPQTPTTFALRTDRWKYIFYHGVWEPDELYDLQADPLERRNLAAEPALQATRDGMRERLFAALVDARGERVIPVDAPTWPGSLYRRRDGAGQGEFPTSWLRGSGSKP